MTDRYRICTRCIMDTTDPEIVFDENGICNHCHRYDENMRTRVIPAEQREAKLSALIAEMKAYGRGKNYDCVIGVSGGVDSTYVAYLCKQWGLRPLAVHFDNGWNSELAVSNIEKTLRRLDIDLHTFVVDWEEFRDLQLAFLKASTPDAEIPTDHAIFALLFREAVRYGVKHVLLGTNIVTEGFLPLLWGYGYYDYRYVRTVQAQFGTKRLKTYPHSRLAHLAYYAFVRRIRAVSILNYIDFQKQQAMDTIEKDLGWVYYGGKHYESIYTRFFQGYILPRKFAIDKRRAHFSALILSDQMTRESAIQQMGAPTYPSEKMLKEDHVYVVKKLGLTEAQFEEIMTAPTKTFRDYKTSYDWIQFATKFRKWLFS